MTTCPKCEHQFDPAPVRVTESVTAVPVGRAVFADPAHRFPIGTEVETRASWARIAEADRLTRARIKAALRRLDIPVSENAVTEALVNGKRSFGDIRDLVRRAVRTLVISHDPYCWPYIVDLTDTDVVYETGEQLYQCTYTLSGDTVELGEPVEVARTYVPVTTPAADEAAAGAAESARGTRVEIGSSARVLEAKGTDASGARIFRVRIIAYGDSKNGRRYPESVLREAAHLYEGAKAFDHHRGEVEMTSGTIQGLVGYYGDVTAEAQGLEANLTLLPSATHAAEALDAALALEGADPLVGISHDAYALFRPIREAGLHLQEATQITSVNSADIVAHPAAGGQATRVVAGGVDTNPAGESAGQSTKESEVPPTKEEILAVLREATDGELAAVGLARPTTEGAPAGESTKEGTPAGGVPMPTTETLEPKGSFLARMLIRSKVEEADLPATMVESITAALPDRISESLVDAQIASLKSAVAGLERAGLTAPATAKVTKEATEKKVGALDAFWAGNYREGYRSLKHAFQDFTGRRFAFDEDDNKVILRESIGRFDSGDRRSTESLESGSWDQALGDSIHRRMIALYSQPSLQTWRQIVSDIVPVNDFRDQKRERIGGYGVLPEVNQGAPYQPLTSPTDEEALYRVIKRGGTEDLTLEMIANDDIGAVRQIPRLLGLAAAITLYRFVWDILVTNAATSYDNTALFHANHNNTATTALSQTALDAAWVRMRQQAGYGDTKNVLSLEPKTLIVPTTMGPLGYQLTQSAVAIPSSGNDPADRPNMYRGMSLIVIDYWTDQNDWFLAADPAMCPTIEVGFYQGREDPELFTQSDPAVGSMFDADKVTYKIRHIYHGTPVEHRGLQRNTVT
ncbi:phage major capsid protein [Actinophytocola sediminis]